jgi:hypothetical protein
MAQLVPVSLECVVKVACELLADRVSLFSVHIAHSEFLQRISCAPYGVHITSTLVCFQVSATNVHVERK